VAQAATIATATARATQQLADDAPHLLLVDDDRALCDVMSRALSNRGFDVTVAHTVEDALHAIAARTTTAAIAITIHPHVGTSAPFVGFQCASLTREWQTAK